MNRTRKPRITRLRLICLIGLIVIMALSVPASIFAQGILVVEDSAQIVRLPRPPIIIIPPHPHPHPIPRPTPPPQSTYKIKELEIRGRILDQIAEVQVSQTFVNTGSRQMEVSFVFPLPYDGAIDRMTLLVDGKEFPAKLLDRDEARKKYEEIVRKNKDPALLEWMGTGMFKTSVFPVPAGASRTVSIRYTQLCRKQDGLTDFLLPLSTAKYTSAAVEKIDIRVTIESQNKIKNVYSPTHEIKIKRPDDKHATISYEVENKIPSSDFRLFYDEGKGIVGARILTYRPDKDKEGFFLLLVTPEIETPKGKHPKKTVQFVLDRSGSMSGKKIEQVRDALIHVLNNLREGDLFNIVAYDSTVESFRPELQRYENDTRKAALGFVDGIYAGGSTNIDGALRKALGQLQDSDRPNYLIFLTDGLPTTGETNEMKIVENASKENRVRARIFTFGVGYDVNSRMLDRLVRDNHGQSEYVRPDEDIEQYVSRLYNRIESPVMTDVRLKFEVDDAKSASPVNRVYPKDSVDLFAGEQLIIVGRYKEAGDAKVTLVGRLGDKETSYDFPAKLVKKSDDESLAFIEKLWAIRRIGEIIDEIDLKGKNDELIEELVELSTKHGILTPYTSFMADEETDVRDVATNARRANLRLEALESASGERGFAQRAAKGQYKNAAQGAGSIAADSFSAPALRSVMPPATTQPAAPSPGMIAGRPVPNQSMGLQGALNNSYGRSGFGGSAPAVDADRAAESELKSIQQNVRNIGARTFYQREGQWIDSRVTESQQNAATRIKQMSDEYFELVRKYGKEVSQYLVFDEPVFIQVEDHAYLIEP